MKGYLSIGAVAKRKQVSIKSLRYYDRIGVFKPAYINQETNYRYYTEEQLYLLDAIGLCVELGIPLRDFEKYADGNHFHLQQLLYDGKILAEQKILDIRARLETVQLALSALEQDAAAPSEAPHSLPKGFYRREIPLRHILTAPLENDFLENYGQKILRLFMLAQLLGMTASYPSGLLYEYQANGSITRSLFVHVDDPGECADKRLKTLPGGSYLCTQNATHRIEDAPKILKEAFASQMPLTVIESDIIEDSLKQHGNSLELQVMA